jgi:thiamine-phosphate pyrophosphorylase
MRAAPGLYAIVDPAFTADPARLALAILRGGCSLLQLRAKSGSDRASLALARRIAASCRDAGVPFVVNDRVDLAILCGADGVHLGQDDLPIAEARRLSSSLVIGRSTHDEAQVDAAVDEGADIVALGPIFTTASKERPDPVVGTARLERVCARLSTPVVAIGGITLERAPAIAAAGARWGAVIGALASAADPEATARDLHRALGGGR